MVMKPPMLRAATAVLTLALCSQVLVFANDREVCRFTGRTMAPCPCPVEHEAPTAPQVGKESCCLTVQGHLPGLPEAVVPLFAVAALGPVGVAVPSRPFVELAPRHEVVRSTASPPRLYVTLRQLLL